MAQVFHLEHAQTGYLKEACPPAFLEVKMHHINGSCTRFTHTEPGAIRSLLDHLHPDRVFRQPRIYIADEGSLSVYQTRSIAWMQVSMESFPAWNFHHDVDYISEITPEEFQNDIAGPVPFLQGMAKFLVAEIELANGERLYHKIYGLKIALLPDVSSALRLLFHDGSCLMARRGEGSAVLVNVANVERMRCYPRSTVISSLVPPAAWPVQKLKVRRIEMPVSECALHL